MQEHPEPISLSCSLIGHLEQVEHIVMVRQDSTQQIPRDYIAIVQEGGVIELDIA